MSMPPEFIPVSSETSEELAREIINLLESEKSLIFYNPSLHQKFIKDTHLKSFKSWPLKRFIGIFSSGSTGEFKVILHEISSFKESAKVSTDLMKELHQNTFKIPIEIIHTALPLFHTGGLLNVFRKWMKLIKVSFIQKIPVEKLQKTSLVVGVPAQLPYLLEKSKEPFSFYSGGDAPSKTILKSSKEKGIHVISTYGLTESCGAILYNNKGVNRSFKDTEILIGTKGNLCFKTQRQAFNILERKNLGEWILYSPENTQGFIETKDLAELKENEVLIKGRMDDLIICGGENINPTTLLKKVEEILQKENLPYIKLKILGMDDPRLGKIPTLFYELKNDELKEQLKIIIKSNVEGLDRPRVLAPYPKTKGVKPSKEEFIAAFKEWGELL